MKTAQGERLASDAMAFVLAGGRGSRLKELTDACAKPAIPFGGGARIIDFAMSNAINSGIRRIGVATQYKQDSLIGHVGRISDILRPYRDGEVACLPGSHHPAGVKHYSGTASAVFHNIDFIERHAPRQVVILAGDHIYKMDYELMLRQHVDASAEVTVGCVLVPRRDATGFGVMNVDEDDRIAAFVEKPFDPPAIPGNPGASLASMGIYVFDTAFLVDQLRRDAADPYSTHDFGGDIIPHLVKNGKAMAHRFSSSCVRGPAESHAYWRDVGTLDAYFDANLDVLSPAGGIDLLDPDWPLWTEGLELPLFRFGRDRERLAPDCRVQRSMLFEGVRLDNRSQVEDSLILPNARVGAGARLNRVIVDSGTHIPAGLAIGEDPDFDAMHFRRTEKGVCLVTQAMIDQLPELLPLRSAA